MSRIFARDRWPLFLAAAVLLVNFSIQAAAVFRATGGKQWFIMDDPYISASIARNLVLFHNYGVSAHIFSSSSSSILWPFLLALLFSLIGFHLWLIIALNVALSLLVLAVCHTVWRRFVPSGFSFLELCILLLILLSGSLVSLVFIGLEHVLQCAAVLALLALGAHAAALDRALPLSRQLRWLLYAAGTLAVLTRFESAFAVFLVALLLFSARRRQAAFFLSLLSALPIAVFGWFSILHGAYFFPNSVLLKGVVQHSYLSGLVNLFGPYSFHLGMTRPWLLVCVLILLASFFLDGRSSRPAYHFAVLVALLTPLHCQFASVGWSFRYEAYLNVLCLLAAGMLAAGIVAAAQSRPFLRPRHRFALRCAVPALLVVLAWSSIPRILATESGIVRNAREIYLQQFQTGRFLAACYPNQPVMVNDVGAVSYMRTAPVIDLWALGTDSITRLVVNKKFNTAAIAQQAVDSGAPVAVVYDFFFQGDTQMPASWTRVSTMAIPATPQMIVVPDPNVPGAVIAPFRTVSVYATTPAQVAPLLDHLRSFLPCLPQDVTVHFLAGPLAPHDFHGQGSCRMNPSTDAPRITASQ